MRKSDMEKIKKYNQIILAIAGTIALLLLLGSGAFAVYEMFSYRDYDELSYDTSIISEEVADSLVVNNNVRKQIISLSDFNLIDSTRSIYVLPVRQKNLGEDEDVNGELLGLMNRHSGYGSKKVGDSRRRYSGVNYNNLIVFGPNLSNPKTLFEDKVSIDNYHYLKYDQKDYLVVRAADEDSNDDGVLNGYDIKKLLMYDLGSGKFIDIESKNNATFLNFANNVSKSELILQYGEDRNRNGEFESNYEPKSYYKLDIQSGKIELLISIEMLEELQGILDGSIDNE